jgi:hypothetical protein
MAQSALYKFLTFVAMIWALYVAFADFEQWFSNQLATTSVALASLLGLSVLAD